MTFTYEDGEALGCQDCACGEEHVCAYRYAVEGPAARRSWILAHLRRVLDD